MSLITHAVIVLAYGALALLAALAFGDQADGGLGGLSGPYLGALLFLGFGLVHQLALRHWQTAELRRSILALKQENRRTAEDVESMRRDMATLRRHQDGETKDIVERHSGELQVVKTLLGQLADRLSRNRPHGRPGAGNAAATATSTTAAATPAAGGAEPKTAPDMEPASLLTAVREALENNRVDLYLQPVVSLPQRKVRFYESFSRIRHRDGTVLLPNQYLTLAAEHGLLTAIDNLLLFQCVQLIRRARSRHRTVGFFVNMSVRSLDDVFFIEQFLEFLQSNQDLTDNLFFEFGQADLLAITEPASAALERLARLGFRFSLDQVQSLDLDYTGLAQRNFRFVRIDASILLSELDRRTADIDVADLKEAMARNGIDLIAEKVESEATVVDLLDLEVDYGQGYLFGEPRRRREDA